MKKGLFLWLTGLVFATTLQGQRRELHIVSANDMHATIEAFPQLAAIVDSLRQLWPSLLVFSAGDNRTGNPLSDKYEIPAYPMVALMNQVGFNASAIGNHEFDSHSLARLMGLSHFRYLCCNMNAEPWTGINALPYQVFDADGLRVGVIGTTQVGNHSRPSTHPNNLEGLTFLPAREVVGQYEWLSRECDVTILLSHQGYEEDCDMADSFPWLDLILGGHTHKQLQGNEMQNNVLITQNKNKLQKVAHVTLTIDGDSIVAKHSEYIDVATFSRKNPVVENMVTRFFDVPSFQRVLAQAATPFSTREEIGYMMCDALMEGCQADIAIENPGGVRLDSLPAGDITVFDVLKMDPFDNHPVVLMLTGHEIVQMILTYTQNSLYSFPFLGGVCCQLTVYPDNPLMIKDIRLFKPEGRRLNMNRKYRVVTNSYVWNSCDMPEDSGRMLDMQTTDLIMQFLENKHTVDYHSIRRIELRQ